MEYDEHKQAEKGKAVLEATLPIVDDADTAKALLAVDSYPLTGYSKVREALQEILLDEIVGFKNKAFDTKREWRIVVGPQELLKQSTNDGGRAGRQFISVL